MTNNQQSALLQSCLPITLYVSKGRHCNRAQTFFPCVRPCSSQQEFLRATICDYTNIRFKGGKRLSSNFESADCLVGDVDNTHSEDPSQWLWPEDIADRLHGVTVYTQYSRNHLKVKNGMSARPKFHFAVPIAPTSDPAEYNRQWRLLKAVVPEIDPATKDLARFMFGGGPTNNGESFPGTLTLTEFCEINEVEPVAEETLRCGPMGSSFSSEAFNHVNEFADDFIIYEGERNPKLFSFARKYYFNYQAYPNRDELVWQKVSCLAKEHCIPPLSERELQNIFRSAKGYADKERAKAISLLQASTEDD